MVNRFCLLDLECVAAPDAEQWLSPAEPDKRLTDPTKIAADIAKKRAEQIARAALDADLCMIVCFAWQTESDREPQTILAEDTTAETRALNHIWGIVSLTRPMAGYGLIWYDLGVLVRRSQLLGVLVPSWVYKQGKYRHEGVIELSDYLTLNGVIDQQRGRGLDYHCRRLGIQVEDAITGKDIGALWAEGRIEQIRQHCRSDLVRIRGLAERLGVIQPALVEQVL
jgi:hypothetical protein